MTVAIEAEYPVSTWRAGTPRTEAEARAMLAEVEPEHAAQERSASLWARAKGRVRSPVRVERDGRLALREVPRAWWRPTHAPDGTLSGGWLDAEVPVLTTLVPHCMASAARVVLPDARDAGEAAPEALAAVQERYGERSERMLWRWVFEDATRRGSGVDLVLEVPPTGPPFHLAAGPYRVPRGWCRGLAPIEETGPVVEPERTWATYCGAVAYLWESRGSRRPSEPQVFRDP